MKCYGSSYLHKYRFTIRQNFVSVVKFWKIVALFQETSILKVKSVFLSFRIKYTHVPWELLCEINRFIVVTKH